MRPFNTPVFKNLITNISPIHFKHTATSTTENKIKPGPGPKCYTLITETKTTHTFAFSTSKRLAQVFKRVFTPLNDLTKSPVFTKCAAAVKRFYDYNEDLTETQVQVQNPPHNEMSEIHTGTSSINDPKEKTEPITTF